jgi:hypothetical protein
MIMLLLRSVKGGALTEENEKMVSVSTTKMLLLWRQHLFMSETPPPLQKVASAPIFGSNNACDDGTGLRLIDVSSLASPLELMKSTMSAN